MANLRALGGPARRLVRPGRYAQAQAQPLRPRRRQIVLALGRAPVLGQRSPPWFEWTRAKQIDQYDQI